MLHDLRRFMTANFGFGDFVFRLPYRSEVGRAPDLRALEEMLRVVPAASVAYHAQRNHFSKWLKARTEFALAHELRPRKVSDFKSLEDLRQSLIRSIADYRRQRGHVVVADFDRQVFDASGDFYRIGGGSLGGKARGALELSVNWRGAADAWRERSCPYEYATILAWHGNLAEKLEAFAVMQQLGAKAAANALRAQLPPGAIKGAASSCRRRARPQTHR